MNHGGKRPGAGRPTTQPIDGKRVQFCLWLGEAQRDKAKALGGSAWLRQMIDEAEMPSRVVADPLTRALDSWR